jgi:histidine triad (HIT) family protein
MEECLFCKFVNKEIPTAIVYESDEILAFNDINPQAPVHILIIPKEHITTMNNLNSKHKKLIGDIVLTAKKLAFENNIAEDGYRIVLNCNKKGGQEVNHIHLHLLGDRQMNWPPG